jgi:hypothetical protein
MIQFLLFTFLLFLGFSFRSYLINNITNLEYRATVSKVYSLNLIALYLTFIFSDSFYIMNYLGWLSSVILVSGYINSVL